MFLRALINMQEKKKKTKPSKDSVWLRYHDLQPDLLVANYNPNFVFSKGFLYIPCMVVTKCENTGLTNKIIQNDTKILNQW